MTSLTHFLTFPARCANRFVVMVWIAFAAAGENASRAFVSRPFVGWAFAELRGGLDANGGATAPTLCAEVAPLAYVALEACGSGGGFLFPASGAELVHFRLEGAFPIFRSGRFDTIAQPGIGFAELENGADEPGFLFGAARGPDQREAAGPEASFGAKGRAWLSPRVYLTSEVTVGAAWISAAPTVLGEGGPLVPFAVATLGAGL